MHRELVPRPAEVGPERLTLWDALGVAADAGTAQVIGAVIRHRGTMIATNGGVDETLEPLYSEAIMSSIKHDITACTNSEGAPEQAIVDQRLRAGAQKLLKLPLGKTHLLDANKRLFDATIEMMANPQASPRTRAHVSAYALSFGAGQIASEKLHLMMQRRLETAQEEHKRLSSRKDRAAAEARGVAVESCLNVAGYQCEAIDVGRTVTFQHIETGKRITYRAGAIAALGGLGLTTGIGQGIADEARPMPVAVEQVTTQHAATGMVMNAVPAPRPVAVAMPEAPQITTPVVAEATQAPPRKTQPQPVAMPEAKQQSTKKTEVAIDPSQRPSTPPQPIPVKEATTKDVVRTPQSSERAPLIRAQVPDDAPKVRAGETPQAALDRVVRLGRSEPAAQLILEQHGLTAPKKLINPKLDVLMMTYRAQLEHKVKIAGHSDAYEDKAITSLGYFDAIRKNPAVLESKASQAFLQSITESGKNVYRDKLYDKYRAHAEKVLKAGEHGRLKGYDRATKAAMIDLFAYTQMALLTDAEQVKRIAEIQDAERKSAARERVKNDVQYDKQGEVIMPEKPTNTHIHNHAIKIMAEQSGDEKHWKNTSIAMEFFIKHGFTPEQAAGIVGNLLVESASSMDPNIRQIGGGPGRGLAQWGAFDPRYDRFGYDGTRGLVAFAITQGKPWHDLQVQLEFIMYEFKTTEKNAYAAVMGAQSVHDAAFQFEDKYERAGVPAHERRYSDADKVYHAYVDAYAGAKQQLTDKYNAAAANAEQQEQQNSMSNGQDILEGFMRKYGKQSGRIPASELSVVDLPGVKPYLQHEAAQRFAALNKAYKERFGIDMVITDHYRDYQAQVDVARTKPGLAAVPGTSNHGWGLAVDMGDAVGNSYYNEKYEWMAENAPKYGWVNPAWAKPVDLGGSNLKQEWWHWEYLGAEASQNPNAALKT